MIIRPKSASGLNVTALERRATGRAAARFTGRAAAFVALVGAALRAR